jgi:hypothetical protein
LPLVTPVVGAALRTVVVTLVGTVLRAVAALPLIRARLRPVVVTAFVRTWTGTSLPVVRPGVVALVGPFVRPAGLPFVAVIVGAALWAVAVPLVRPTLWAIAWSLIGAVVRSVV